MRKSKKKKNLNFLKIKNVLGSKFSQNLLENSNNISFIQSPQRYLSGFGHNHAPRKIRLTD